MSVLPANSIAGAWSTRATATFTFEFGLKVMVTFLVVLSFDGTGTDAAVASKVVTGFGIDSGTAGGDGEGESASGVTVTLNADFGLRVMVFFLDDGFDIGARSGAAGSSALVAGLGDVSGTAGGGCEGEDVGDGVGTGGGGESDGESAAAAGVGTSFSSLLEVRVCRQVDNTPPPMRTAPNGAPRERGSAVLWTCGTSGETSDRDMSLRLGSGIGSGDDALVFAVAPRTRGPNSVLLGREAKPR